MPVAVLSLSWNVLVHPKVAHSLSLEIFFDAAVGKVCVSFLLSACYSMIQYSREKSFMKYSITAGFLTLSGGIEM